MLFLAKTGSLVAGTILFVMLAVAAILVVLALRSLGIGRDHPLVQRMAERPWRDGRDVLQLGLRHLPEVFIVTPSGSLLAPEAIELRMNPGDLASLTETMDLGLIDSSASEVYQDQVTARGVEVAGAARPGSASSAIRLFHLVVTGSGQDRRWASRGATTPAGPVSAPAGGRAGPAGDAGRPAGAPVGQPGAPVGQPPGQPLGRGPAWPSSRPQPPADSAPAPTAPPHHG